MPSEIVQAMVIKSSAVGRKAKRVKNFYYHHKFGISLPVTFHLINFPSTTFHDAQLQGKYIVKR